MTAARLSCYIFFIGLIFGYFLAPIAQGQTLYTLPDTNFRNKLTQSYPSVMQNGKLNTTAAATLTGWLDLSTANISNGMGISYFTSINYLNLSNNNLTTLPEIQSLTQLSVLFAKNNQLVSFPTLTANSNLLDLQIDRNQLTDFPDIRGLSNLQNIYVFENKIKKVPSLATNPNLRILHVSKNDLDSLPDLSPLTHLTQLHFDNNRISSIKGLQALNHLQIVYAWNNQLSDISGLSTNTTLSILHISGNKLTSLPRLSNKRNLHTLEISYNKLTFSTLQNISISTTLSLFSYGNQDSVGQLQRFTQREGSSYRMSTPVDASVSTNSYYWYKNNTLVDSTQGNTFQIPSLALSDSGTYTLHIKNPAFPALTLRSRPWKLQTLFQKDTIGNDSTVLKREKDQLTWQLPTPNLNQPTRFFWYKNGQLTDSSTQARFTWPSLSRPDSGTYTVKIIRPGYPWLTQFGPRWTIKVLDCMQWNNQPIQILDNDCNQGITISFSNKSITGNNQPFAYTLTRADGLTLDLPNNQTAERLSPGKHTLTATDTKGCSLSQTFTLPKKPECEDVFSPDGLGPKTTYYIEATGRAQIVDLKGNIIKNLDVPAHWDGTKNDFSKADTGYYAIIVNDKKYANVTLVR